MQGTRDSQAEKSTDTRSYRHCRRCPSTRTASASILSLLVARVWWHVSLFYIALHESSADQCPAPTVCPLLGTGLLMMYLVYVEVSPWHRAQRPCAIAQRSVVAVCRPCIVGMVPGLWTIYKCASVRTDIKGKRSRSMGA